MKLRIRDLREDNDLYQRHIAEYLNCTQQTYSRYETGELEPSLPVMEKLAAYYDTSVDFLMGLTDVREPYKGMRKAERKQEK
ncbi:MAG: helix-turn-helix transcriptional regulator [Oscillospiraceae bacterium]|nr:helix-turn-helix transcriptional regulator [Oscillospiraceae bacterium]